MEIPPPPPPPPPPPTTTLNGSLILKVCLEGAISIVIYRVWIRKSLYISEQKNGPLYILLWKKPPLNGSLTLKVCLEGAISIVIYRLNNSELPLHFRTEEWVTVYITMEIAPPPLNGSGSLTLKTFLVGGGGAISIVIYTDSDYTLRSY